MRVLPVLIAFLLGAGLGVRLGLSRADVAPSSPLLTVTGLSEVPEAVLGSSPTAIDRIYVLEHENQALRLALASRAPSPTASDGILPYLPSTALVDERFPRE